MIDLQSLLFYLVVVLALLNVAQLAFFMLNVQRLIDKLMSRNYYEVVQADKLKAEKNKTQNQVQEVLEDDYSTINANRANNLFGLSS